MYYAIGLNTEKQYAMAGKKSELLKKLALIFPSFIQLSQSDGTFRKKSLKKIYPEPLRIIKGDKK